MEVGWKTRAKTLLQGELRGGEEDGERNSCGKVLGG